MSSAFTKFQPFVQNLGRKVFNLNADALKVLLTNVAPVNTNNQKSDLTEIAAGNGYTAGGAAVPNVAYSQSAGTGTLVGDSITWTASGGTIGPFRYAVLYDPAATNSELIGFWDYGSAATLNSGDTFQWKPNSAGTGGSILTLA